MSYQAKAISYIRWSTPQQDLGDSESRQILAAEAYAKSHGFELDTSAIDAGVSGTGRHLRDGALGKLVDRIQAGHYPKGTLLIIEAIDRLSRLPHNKASAMINSIIDRGLSIHTLEDGNTITPANRNSMGNVLQLAVKICAAHEYSVRLGNRLASTKAKALARARAEGTPATKKCPAWLKLADDRSRFVPIPDRVATVQRIYELAALGEGSPTIATILNRENVPQFGQEAQGITLRKHKPAARWETEYVSKILTTRAVLGEFQPLKRSRMLEDELLNNKQFNNGEPIQGYYPSIINVSLFNTVQENRKRNMKGGNRTSGRVRNISADGKIAYSGGTTKLHNLFSGLVFCAYCSGSMTFVSSASHGTQKRYLYCKATTRGVGCGKRGAIAVGAFEKAVLDRLQWMDREGLLKPRDNNGDEIQKEIDRLMLIVDAAERRRDRAAAVTDAEEYELVSVPTLRVVGKQIKELQSQLDGARQRLIKASDNDLEASSEAVRALGAAALEGDYEARMRVRTALRSLISRIECNTVTKVCAVIVAKNAYSFMVGGNGISYDFARYIDQFGEGITPLMLPTVEGDGAQAAGLSRLLTRLGIEATKK